MESTKNLFLAFALSMGVLLLWGWMFPSVPQPNNTQTEQGNASSAEQPTNRMASNSRQEATTPHPDAEVVTTEIVESFGNDVITLSINAKGWISHAELNNYQETLEDPSKVKLLSMGDTHYEAYINSGVVGQALIEPFRLVSSKQLGGQSQATFEAMLSDGYRWQRVYTLTENSYLIDVQDRIEGGAGLKLYRQVVERNPVRAMNNFYEHIGPIGLFNDKLSELSYEDLDEGGAKKFAAMGGWIGMMSRYFMMSIHGSDQDESYRYYYKGDGRSYQAGMIHDGVIDQGDVVFNSTLFIGPKSVPLLEQAHVELERSVNFGWFAFIAKPMHEIMLWMNQYVSNFGVIIILLVIGLKIILFIPTQSAYRSMASMRKLQPEMMRLKERYGDDRAKMGQEVMAMYKKHKVNPLGGCLPILLQMPVFFALYKVLLISIELRQAPFYGWIEDMSVQDPFFILPIVMGASMYIQQKLNPQPTDPMQAKVMQFLPILFTALFLFFPAGLVLYWVVNNILSIIQQRLVMKSMNVD
ncbi:MAG: membrane protein insertase YidC [Mariprofundaceae bacterium]|nr:membrane protein insertase YidC [Mariprofundaceae bacterium]